MGFSFLYSFSSFMRFVPWLSLFHLAVAYFAFSMQSLCHDDERSVLLQFKQSLDVDKLDCYYDPSISFANKSLCHDYERSALLQFKQSLSIDEHRCSYNPSISYPKVESWKLEGENSTTDCCSWDGIKCNEDTGHVIKLNLSKSCLEGYINSTSTLFHLVHLQWLSLAGNSLSYSKIPPTISNLSRLEHLDLHSSYFSGQIPSELLELSNLVYLDLSNNYHFMVPENQSYYLEFREPSLSHLAEKLTNLKVLDLREVHISSPLPHNFANLSSLTYLSLEGCELQGEFPTKIFQLPNISILDVSDNSNLTGYLPEFEKSSPLTFLDIALCNFSGTIPSSLGNLTKLVILDFSFNNFLGELPVSIGNLGSLEQLFFEGVNLSGQISSPLANLTQLLSLDLSHSHTKFSSQNSSSMSWIAKYTKLTYLDLSDLNLVGEIPFWLMNLTQLTFLDLSQNQLTGSIPSCLMSINQLSSLSLHSNKLTGQIPSQIRNLTKLVELLLSSNSLKGPIPSTIFDLKNLRYLNLELNNLSGIVELDMFLNQLQSLEDIILSSNKLSILSNTIANYTNFPKLMMIKLSSCNLTKFPNFLRYQDQLRVLDLSTNKLSGRIPCQFLNVAKSLAHLNLSHNFFTGFDKHLIALPSSLVTLDLRSNKLQGLLPVPKQHTIGHYLVSDNKLTGEILPWICNLNYLYALDLSNNNLGGVLPQCLFNFSSYLSVLALQNNKFHGSIPQTFINGTNLRMIDLSNNKLRGMIPRSLVNCAKLQFLHLGNNQISDTFPSWLGTLPELKVLVLKSNRFHGAIRDSGRNFEFPKLQIIDLSHNILTGELPSKSFQHWNALKVHNNSKFIYLQDELQAICGCGPIKFELLGYDYSLTISNKGIEMKYGKISNMLTSIILSDNKFVGEVPTSIACLKGLRNLNLSQNNLEGQIPLSLGNLTELESLDLSNNTFSGQIPQQLTEITSLAVFDVSYNHLIGPIPHGKQFDTFENGSYDGNPGLCGKPLSKKCENVGPLEKIDEDKKSLFVFDWKIVFPGFASGLIVGVVLGAEFYTRKHEWLVNIFGIRRMKWRGHNN